MCDASSLIQVTRRRNDLQPWKERKREGRRNDVTVKEKGSETGKKKRENISYSFPFFLPFLLFVPSFLRRESDPILRFCYFTTRLSYLRTKRRRKKEEGAEQRALLLGILEEQKKEERQSNSLGGGWEEKILCLFSSYFLPLFLSLSLSVLLQTFCLLTRTSRETITKNGAGAPHFPFLLFAFWRVSPPSISRT